MPMYASDIDRVFPGGTTVADIQHAARLDPGEARDWASDALESAKFLRDQVSLEDLTRLLTEAGERSLNLSALVRGEISTLMKVKQEEISYDRWAKEWAITLPSGSIVFGEMEDFTIEIMGAKINS